MQHSCMSEYLWITWSLTHRLCPSRWPISSDSVRSRPECISSSCSAEAASRCDRASLSWTQTHIRNKAGITKNTTNSRRCCSRVQSDLCDGAASSYREASAFSKSSYSYVDGFGFQGVQSCSLLIWNRIRHLRPDSGVDLECVRMTVQIVVICSLTAHRCVRAHENKRLNISSNAMWLIYPFLCFCFFVVDL